jgi:hypothetical protein
MSQAAKFISNAIAIAHLPFCLSTTCVLSNQVDVLAPKFQREILTNSWLCAALIAA